MKRLTSEQAREIAHRHADDICESIASKLDIYLEDQRASALEYVEDELTDALENLRIEEGGEADGDGR
jgi:hypothetical protein